MLGRGNITMAFGSDSTRGNYMEAHNRATIKNCLAKRGIAFVESHWHFSGNHFCCIAHLKWKHARLSFLLTSSLVERMLNDYVKWWNRRQVARQAPSPSTSPPETTTATPAAPPPPATAIPAAPLGPMAHPIDDYDIPMTDSDYDDDEMEAETITVNVGADGAGPSWVGIDGELDLTDDGPRNLQDNAAGIVERYVPPQFKTGCTHSMFVSQRNAASLVCVKAGCR